MSDGADLILNRQKIEKYIGKHIVRGREDYGDGGQGAVKAIADRLMEELDTDKDGVISWLSFSEWNRSNSVEQVVSQLSRAKC